MAENAELRGVGEGFWVLAQRCRDAERRDRRQKIDDGKAGQGFGWFWAWRGRCRFMVFMYGFPLGGTFGKGRRTKLIVRPLPSFMSNI